MSRFGDLNEGVLNEMNVTALGIRDGEIDTIENQFNEVKLREETKEENKMNEFPDCMDKDSQYENFNNLQETS